MRIMVWDVRALLLSLTILVSSFYRVESFTTNKAPSLLSRISQSSRTNHVMFSSVAESHPEDGTFWTWKGHEIYTRIPNNNKKSSQKVLLIHGFGCSTTYWRSTIETLESNGYQVHSVDLLGQGYSSKPSSVTYSINLWANMIDDYITHIAQDEDDDVVLIGNSLGSLIALAAATGDFKEDKNMNTVDVGRKKIRGICMCNCANGLNSKGTVNEVTTASVKIIFTILYGVLEVLIFRNKLLLNYVLENVVTKELLKDTLKNLYLNDPSRVDDALVDSFYGPAQQKGAVDALSQIYVNDPGKTPMNLHDDYADLLANYCGEQKPLPIHLVWGDQDYVTPLGGGVATFYSQLAADSARTATTMDIVTGGHVPFDDNPESTNASILKWIDTLSAETKTAKSKNFFLSLFGI